MSNQSGAASRDFGFQTSDQAGGASQQYPQPPYNSYNAEQDTSSAEAMRQAYSHDSSAAYHDYSAQHSEINPGQLTDGGFSLSAPTGWDWANSIDFSDFTNQYEPQGELVQEYQNQVNLTNDFSIPLPVSTENSIYQAFQQHQSATPAPNATQPQKSLSPPPPPPQSQQRPVVQTGMKRKVDSEPSPAVSQAGGTAVEHPPKRRNKSRQPSDASPSTPTISSPPTARAPTVARTVAPSTPSEAA